MTRRVPVILLVAAVLVAGGVADRRRRAVAPPGAERLQPTAASASALSSTWYCTGATGAANGTADAVVVVANAGTRALRGTVTFVPSQGDPREVPLDVAPASRVSVRGQDAVSAPYLSALIEVDGGQAVAEMVVSGPLGVSAAPCASSASDHWYFADGATTKDANEVIGIFNPFPEDAIVDLSFGTEEGRVSPEALTGLVVKGRRMVSVNVGDHVHRRQVVATSIGARVGRIVAARHQSFDGTAGRKGSSLALGAPAPSDRWYFPDGLVLDGLNERFQVFNPFREEAMLDVDFALDSGEAEPMQLRVPPESRLTIAANTESRIPKGVLHATTVRVSKGEGVVVERTVDGTPPAPRSGVSWTLGSRTLARRWAFAAGGADDTVEQWISVQNPGARAATLDMTVLGDGERLAVEGLQHLTVPPGQRAVWRLNDYIKRASTPLVVRSDVPVVAERGFSVAKGGGTAMTIGVPL